MSYKDTKKVLDCPSNWTCLIMSVIIRQCLTSGSPARFGRVTIRPFWFRSLHISQTLVELHFCMVEMADIDPGLYDPVVPTKQVKDADGSVLDLRSWATFIRASLPVETRENASMSDHYYSLPCTVKGRVVLDCRCFRANWNCIFLLQD